MYSVLIQEPGMEDDISDDGKPPPSQAPPQLQKDGNSLNLVGENDGGSSSSNNNAETATASATKATEPTTDEAKPKSDAKPAIAAKPSQATIKKMTKEEDQKSLSSEHDTTSEADGEVKTLQDIEDPFNEKATQEANNDGCGFEASFEANFDDAFTGGGGGEQSTDLDVNPAEVIDAPKQVVGGRASIPEELDSNQLARLQSLKESNA